MGERFKPTVLKTVELERVPGVRIPLPPPFSLRYREPRLRFQGIARKERICASPCAQIALRYLQVRCRPTPASQFHAAREFDFSHRLRRSDGTMGSTSLIPGSVSLKFNLGEPIDACFVEVECHHLTPFLARRCKFDWFHLTERSTPGNASGGLSARDRHLHF